MQHSKPRGSIGRHGSFDIIRVRVVPSDEGKEAEGDTPPISIRVRVRVILAVTRATRRRMGRTSCSRTPNPNPNPNWTHLVLETTDVPSSGLKLMVRL